MPITFFLISILLIALCVRSVMLANLSFKKEDIIPQKKRLISYCLLPSIYRSERKRIGEILNYTSPYPKLHARRGLQRSLHNYPST